MRLPDDLWRVIATLSEDDLVGVLRLRLVNKQFARLMKHPSVISHLHFNFAFHREVPLVMVSDVCFHRAMPPDWLGPLTVGVRRASIHNVDPDQSFKILNNLRHLTVYHSTLGDLPGFLETLSLYGCHVNPDVNLRHCKTLEINYCASFDFNRVSDIVWLESLKLKEDPICNLSFAKPLSSLRELHVSQCRPLVDVSAIMGLLSLQALWFEYCPLLVDIDALFQLSNLTQLSLLECHAIKPQDVQRAVDRLPMLSQLAILHHELKELALGNLPHLICLCLYDCIKLTDLHELPIGIIELNLEHCYTLTDFSELARLVHLQDANLWGTCIRFLPNLPSLQILNVNNCDNLTDGGLLSVLPCPNLHSVLAHNCELLSDRIEDRLIASEENHLKKS
jgi:hypothetical protein